MEAVAVAVAAATLRLQRVQAVKALPSSSIRLLVVTPSASRCVCS
jgi:hypothetical protein